MRSGNLKKGDPLNKTKKYENGASNGERKEFHESTTSTSLSATEREDGRKVGNARIREILPQE